MDTGGKSYPRHANSDGVVERTVVEILSRLWCVDIGVCHKWLLTGGFYGDQDKIVTAMIICRNNARN